MINTPKEAEDFPLKQKTLYSTDHHEKAKASTTSSSPSSSQWLKLKDPRIVRVSRAFGGKDRHSKVCTIRGLRDRRVRLSVPTAIDLYDLQDRLGLNQPSKVVDWLLNVAKHEIDELPPLPIPPGNFTLGYPSLSTNFHDVSQNNNTSICKSSKSKQVSGENIVSHEEEDKQGSNLLPIGLLNTMPVLGYNQLENSSADHHHVSQLANHLGFVNQISDHGINVVPFPSSLSLSTGSATTTSYFPAHVGAMENMDPRQINHHYQMLMMSSSSQNNSLINPSQQLMRINPPKPFHSPNSSESHSHNDQDFPSK